MIFPEFRGPICHYRALVLNSADYGRRRTLNDGTLRGNPIRHEGDVYEPSNTGLDRVGEIVIFSRLIRMRVEGRN